MKQESLLHIRRLLAAGLCTMLLTAANGVSADTEYRELKLGTEHNDVADLQERLTELGYYNGRISGHYGELTRDARAGVSGGQRSGGRRHRRRGDAGAAL